MKVLKGIGVSPGVAIGPAYVFLAGRIKIARRFIRPEDVEKELNRFREAIELTAQELEEVKKHIPEGMPQALSIIDAHLLMLKDPILIRETEKVIRERRVNSEWALLFILERYKKLFATLEDPYLRERIHDLEQLVDRAIMALQGRNNQTHLSEPAIIVAHDLSPADTARLQPETTRAFVTEVGSRTSHTAIVARSLGFPAVVAVTNILKEVNPGDLLAVDGLSGEVIINPTEEVIEDFLDRELRYKRRRSLLHHQAKKPAITKDNRKIAIRANLELVDEIPLVMECGAEGVGLYRTEYLYVTRRTLPTEDELLHAYRQVVEGVKPYPVTIRTLDIGGDKFASQFDLPEEINPALGLRAIRLCLKNPEFFKIQLRAILRASAFGKVRIMFPLVSGLGELLEAKRLLWEVMQELRERGVDFDEDIQVGAMIEVPSAAAVADLLAREADFFSIGTNDLIQYALAIDRGNEQVAHLYEPLHPGILRIIRQIVTAGHEAGIEVAMCGEMAGELHYVPLLIGLGLDELSMNAQTIPEVKSLVRELNYEECRVLAEEALKLATPEEVSALLQEWMKRITLDLSWRQIWLG